LKVIKWEIKEEQDMTILAKVIGTKPVVAFGEWLAEVSSTRRRYDGKLQEIVARDNQFQLDRQARGGVMESSLTEKSQDAAALVMRRREAEVRSYLGPKLSLVADEHVRLIAEAAALYQASAEKMDALRAFETEMTGFLRSTGSQIRPTISDPDFGVRAQDFERRAQRITNPTIAAPRPVARPGLRDLDLSDIVAS
jgi:hypothetical protein